MYATHYFEDKVLSVFSGAAFLAPSNLFVALYLNNPTDSGKAGTEVNYTGYTRQPITFTPIFEESGGLGIKNDNNLLYPESPVEAGTVRYIGIIDSPVAGAGNMLLYGELSDPMTIRSGQQPSIQIGDVLYYIVGNSSVWFKNQILSVLHGESIQSITPYLCLYDGDPENLGVELSGGAYERQFISFSSPVVLPTGQTIIQNNVDIIFPAPTSTWGVWAWDALRSASTGGNLVYKFRNPRAEELLKNYVPAVRAGQYRITID